MRIADICPTCATYTNAVCVIYDGPYLTNINVSPLDNLQDILGSINDNLVPIVQTGVPSGTAVYVGQLYVNSTSGTMYYANSIAGGGGSWTQLAPSSAIPTTPSLDAVLAVGNTSTYSINIQNLLVAPTTITTITPGGIGIGDATGAINIGTSVISVYNTGVINNIDIDGITGSIRITTGGGTGEIFATNLTGNQTFQLPNASGTIALTSDITLQNATAGTNKNLVNGINLQGTGAGIGQSGVEVIGIGTSALNNNTGSYITAIGYEAGKGNTGTSCYLFGDGAGTGNTGDNSILIGNTAGYNNAGDNITAIGLSAGDGNTGNIVNLLGRTAGTGNTGDFVIAIGNDAGNSNTLSGMTIFSNSSMPSYVDFAAASAAINVGTGASSGSTYLYHDQTTNSIGAVRIP